MGIALLAAIFLVGCAAAPSGARTRIDEVPMYGGMDRNADARLKAGDEEFIRNVLTRWETRSAASKAWVDQGFEFYRGDQLGMAMRRFNQAWLLDTNNPDVYWGFAAVLFDQGKLCDATGMIDIAFAKGKLQDGFLPDAATIYNGCGVSTKETGEKAARFKRADELFEQAYALPTVRKAYTLEHWARALAVREDYAGAWAKVAQFRRETGEDMDPRFIRALRSKMPEPTK